MKHMKKIAALLTTASLALSMMLTGCESNRNKTTTEDGTETKVQELTELSVYCERAGATGEVQGWMGKLLADRFGVKLYVQSDTCDGTTDEAGNYLADLIILDAHEYDGAVSDYDAAIANGNLYDICEGTLLDDTAPYVAEHMSSYLAEEEADHDGKLYGIPSGFATSDSDITDIYLCFNIRWDLYQALGYPEVQTLDDLADVLIDMKELCPTDDNGEETYALSLWSDWDTNMVAAAMSIAKMYYGMDDDCTDFQMVDVGTGEAYGCLSDQAHYVDALAFLNKLNQNGLIDPASATQTFDEATEKVAAGGAFLYLNNYAGVDAYNTEAHMAAGKLLAPLMPEEAVGLAYSLQSTRGDMISINANAADKEKCMEIINFLATPEGQLTTNYGPQGLCWDYDENGNTYFTEYGRSAYEDSSIEVPDEWGGGTFADGYLKFDFHIWDNNATNPETPEDEYNAAYWLTNESLSDIAIMKDWQEQTGCNSYQRYLRKHGYNIASGATDDAAENQDEQWQTLSELIRDYSWKAIFAASDEEFEAIIKEMREQASS